MAQLLDPEHWGRGSQPDASNGAAGTAAGRGSQPDASSGAAEARPPGPRRTGASTPAGAAKHEWDPFADEPAPASPRTPRSGSAPPPAPPRTTSRLPLILGIVLVVLALLAAGIWAAASGLLPFGSSGGAPAPEKPAASAPATDAPEPSESPAPAEPAGTPLPASCDEVFSDSMRATLEADGFVLNPEWTEAEGLRLPTNDEQLSALLEPLPRLDCGWLPPEGAGAVGVITSIAQVTPEQQAAVEARIEELGWAQNEELGSIRYVFEQEEAGNRLGQSHFLRDGLWFATGWINYGPTGYTADMVTQVLG